MNKQFQVGGDLIDILTTGMYLNPLNVLREFVQNATDSFEKLSPNDRKGLSVQIWADKNKRTVTVKDNGPSLASSDIERHLLSLGFSEKKGKHARGFRGIGRLAALGYCEFLIFRIYNGADDCITKLTYSRPRLREWMSSRRETNDIYDLVQFIVSREEEEITPETVKGGSFFEVTMVDVDKVDRKDCFLDEPSISAYLSQVCPVPFSPDFTFADAIERELEDYFDQMYVNIHLNGSSTPIYKPYSNSVLYQKGELGTVTDVVTDFIWDDDGEAIAFIWYAEHDFNGTIMPSSLQGRIRVRQGNIQLGEANFLNEWFSETRFNGWHIGELHILSEKLVPNARRDAFLASEFSGELQNLFESHFMNMSQLCRESSKKRSLEVARTKAETEANSQTEDDKDNLPSFMVDDKQETENSSNHDMVSEVVLKILMEELNPKDARRLFRQIVMAH